MAFTATSSGVSSFLDEPKAGRLTVQYAPAADGQSLENPPRFAWLPVIEEDARYVLRVSKDSDFKTSDTIVYEDIPVNFFTPDHCLEPGAYHWSYAVWCPVGHKPITNWSTVRSFVLEDGLPETPLASRGERLGQADLAHPRLWLGPEQLEAFSKDVDRDPEHCDWSTFF